MEYMAIVPDVCEEVRMKVLEQFPECITFIVSDFIDFLFKVIKGVL